LTEVNQVELEMNHSDNLQSRVFRVAKNLINLYAKPDSSSEVVTQAFLNAKLVVESEDHGFFYVVGADRYHGWADSRHLEVYTTSVSEASSKSICSHVTVSALLADVFFAPEEDSELATRLVYSTSVELADDVALPGGFQAICLPGAKHGWIRTTDLRLDSPKTLNSWSAADSGARKSIIKNLGVKVLAHAERFIGVPYLWGGCSPFGIDCSGLVQVCYLMEGLSLLRDADIQYTDRRFAKVEPGKSLSESKFQPGDLLVFGSQSAITHIGIASDDGRFIHASGRKANFGTYYNACSDKSWSEIYLGAVRLSEDAALSITSA
jgi:cell wall-associated NlpC family hydrolase